MPKTKDIQMESNKCCLYRIVKDLNLIICYYRGAITLNDMVSLTKKLLADSEFSTEFNVMIDFKDTVLFNGWD